MSEMVFSIGEESLDTQQRLTKLFTNSYGLELHNTAEISTTKKPLEIKT
jgi:hypothetical protein